MFGRVNNLAFLLEGLNERLNTHFLASQDFIGQINSDNFKVRFRGEQAVRGLEENIPLFEIDN